MVLRTATDTGSERASSEIFLFNPLNDQDCVNAIFHSQFPFGRFRLSNFIKSVTRLPTEFQEISPYFSRYYFTFRFNSTKLTKF